MTKMFIKYNGTVDQFKVSSYQTDYANSIVFISGDDAGTGAAIYAQGKYYGNVIDAVANFKDSLKCFAGIKVGNVTAEANAHNSVIEFIPSDPNTIEINTSKNGITFGLTSNAKTAIGKVATLESNVSTLQSTKANQSDLTTLSGTVTTLQGTVANKVGQDAVDTAKGEAIESANGYTDTAISGVNNTISNLNTTVGNHTTSINTLVNQLDGIANTKGSVKEAIASSVSAAINKIMIGENGEGTVPEAFDTLKEIAAWIGEGNTNMDAAKIIADLNTAKADIIANKEDADGKFEAIDGLISGHTTEIAGVKEIAESALGKANAIGMNTISGAQTQAIVNASFANGKFSFTRGDIAAANVTIVDSANKLAAATVEAAIAELASMWEWEELPK